MKSAKGWQWLCIGMMAAAFSLATTGCGGGDDDDAAATPAPAAGGGAGGGGGKDDSDSPPSVQAPAQTQVLWDDNKALMSGDTHEFKASVPADGTVSIKATWTAIDLISGSDAPIDSAVQFRVNHAMLSDHHSPYSWSGAMSKGEYCAMVMKNNATDTRATVHVRAVFTPN